jgi:hypothetical protein
MLSPVLTENEDILSASLCSFHVYNEMLDERPTVSLLDTTVWLTVRQTTFINHTAIAVYYVHESSTLDAMTSM